MEIIKEIIDEKGETIVYKTDLITEQKIDQRPSSDTFGKDINILRSAIIEDHGSWNASWDLISFDQIGANINLQKLRDDHMK